jgi:TatA/E family protein of Tat protein translocase
MSIGPAEILVILVIALIVFGPQRLPEVGRQVGSAMRELRKVQDAVRAELDTVLHGDVVTPEPPTFEESNHAALPPAAAPGAEPADDFTAPPDSGSFS